MNIGCIATHTIDHILGMPEIHIKKLAECGNKKLYGNDLATKHSQGIKYKNAVDNYYYKSTPIFM